MKRVGIHAHTNTHLLNINIQGYTHVQIKTRTKSIWNCRSLRKKENVKGCLLVTEVWWKAERQLLYNINEISEHKIYSSSILVNDNTHRHKHMRTVISEILSTRAIYFISSSRFTVLHVWRNLSYTISFARCCPGVFL